MTDTKDDQFFSGKWIRKCTESEEALEESHQVSSFISWYQLDLSSAEPIPDNHVKTAVDHLYRKVATLSVCFGNRDGEMWFRRATNPNADFKVLQGLRLEEVRESLRTIHYESYTGPLFCVRLLRDSPDLASDNADLEPSLPHKFHVIFGLHHGMTDGTSSCTIMGYFVTMLNDVISDKPIDDEEIIGTFATNEETFRLITEKKPIVERDSELKKKIAEDAQYRKTQLPLLITGFPKPKEKKHTVTVVNTVDLSTTAKFLQRCKQESVSVNSVFSAVMNMAIVDTLIEYGVIQESYIIQGLHTVNMRQFWENVPSKTSLGMHMSYPLTMLSKTPKDVHAKFWDYARELGQSMKHYLKSGRLLSDKAYDLLYPDSDAGNTYQGDYITANMGNVITKVTEGGPHVKATRLTRGSTVHESAFAILLSCQSFRGRFTFALDYNTAVVEAAVAEKIYSQFLKGIDEIVE